MDLERKYAAPFLVTMYALLQHRYKSVILCVKDVVVCECGYQSKKHIVLWVEFIYCLYKHSLCMCDYSFLVVNFYTNLCGLVLSKLKNTRTKGLNIHTKLSRQIRKISSFSPTTKKWCICVRLVRWWKIFHTMVFVWNSKDLNQMLWCSKWI